MLSNAKRIELCYSLLSEMLPDAVAQNFGFPENPEHRIWLANTNQTPRPESDTVMFFSVKDEPYKQAISDPHHYTQHNIEVIEQMRQIRLTVDVYSKVVPMGTANDTVRWLNSALVSDAFEEWKNKIGWGVGIERIDIMPDLSYLVEGQVWNERAQLIIYLNYRDSIKMFEPTPMTRVPLDIDDVKASVDYEIHLIDNGGYPNVYYRYWGVWPTKTITEQDILNNFDKDTSQTRKQVRTFDCTGGKYIFLVIPTALVNGMTWRDANGLNFSDYDTFTLNLHQESDMINYTVCVVNNKQTGNEITFQIL